MDEILIWVDFLFQDTRGDGYSLGPDGKIDGNDAYNFTK